VLDFFPKLPIKLTERGLEMEYAVAAIGRSYKGSKRVATVFAEFTTLHSGSFRHAAHLRSLIEISPRLRQIGRPTHAFRGERLENANSVALEGKGTAG
jgi:hypothetical protein